MVFLVAIFLGLCIFVLPWWVVLCLGVISVFLLKVSPFVITVPFILMDLVYATGDMQRSGIYAYMTVFAFMFAYIIKISLPKLIWHLD